MPCSSSKERPDPILPVASCAVRGCAGPTYSYSRRLELADSGRRYACVRTSDVVGRRWEIH